MTTPPHVVVMGGGFAGLSCATALAESGARVTLLEARRALGGRAGSFVDEATGEVVDNGQHLFMRCYRETRAFLDRIGTGHLLRFQKNLTVDYLHHGHHSRLKCPGLPAPWHLLAGVLMLKGPALADRLAVLRAGPALRRLRTPGGVESLEALTVTEWLDRLGQTSALRRWLWHPLAIATLNESPDIAPASLLASVLVEGFLHDSGSSALGVATVGLSELYTEAATRFIQQRGGAVRFGAAATALRCAGPRVTGVEIRDGGAVDADAFVSALPPAALARIGVPVAGLDRFASSPILSINLWIDRPLSGIAPFDFAGIVDGRIQWLFNKERILDGKAHHLAAVISAARDQVGRSNEELAAMAWDDVRTHLPAARAAQLVRSMVVRERTATFSATVQTEPLRPGHRSPYDNLHLAGDWTERGLPATIETAVRTGHRCARLIAAATPGAEAEAARAFRNETSPRPSRS
ncbi:MAG TPA: hydroxysqualene dehydroxylase HpnE [Patescibacteria group bacterium]|nr:hydroxysqualene dehydroxylase HpnE [Patescibacteria group bacterium]